MPINFPCSSCSTKMRAPDAWAGRQIKCPKCGTPVTIASAEAPPAPAPAAPAAFPPPPAPAPPRKTPVKPPFDAVAIVRAVAEKHKAGGVLKKLGKLNPKHIANARAGFAKEMAEGEVPLVLIDRSFLQNGKAGLLLTDRKLYSSSLRRPVSLGEVRTASSEKPTFSEQMLKHTRPEPSLLVNGNVVYTGPAKAEFWTELLPKLGQALRQAEGPSPSGVSSSETSEAAVSAPSRAAGEGGPSSAPAGQDLARIAAAAVCSGQAAEAVVALLTEAGLEAEEAEAMTEEMKRIYRQARKGSVAFLRFLGGLVLTIFGLFMAVMVNVHTGRRPGWMEPVFEVLEGIVSRSTLDPMMKGLAVLGLILFFSGFYRLIAGNPPLKTEELLAAWRARQPPKKAALPA